MNADESQEILRITGPNMCSFNWCCNCCADKIFDLETPDRQLVGTIRKKWSGPVKEMFTDADNFIAEFPIDLDAKAKGTLLGATFLIDFLAFENNQNQQKS
ncbi:unnamed protein product, partial [Mesorhabditis belari]|uniref:Phospholipid scramblase n=1 Tax=Mesorhabditis belari TaxID=2138241 RepID=A0AAF3F815_9BILA